jgi:hypothetical protein
VKEYLVKRYTFEELEDSAKERAIEKMTSRLWEWVDYDLIKEYLEEDLWEKLGGVSKDIKLALSLGYSQGDGVAIYGRLHKENAPNLLWPEGVENVNLERNSWGAHYSHYNSFNVDFYDEEYNEVSPYNTDGNLRDDFNAMAKSIRDICKSLEDQGYKYIESDTSRESAIEYLENNYSEEFTIDGDLDPITITDTAEVLN